MPLEAFRTKRRSFTRGATEVTPEIEAVFLSLIRVDRDGNVHPRLSRANHMKILRSLWEQDSRALLRRVRVPTLVLGVRSAPGGSDPSGFIQANEQAAAAVRGWAIPSGSSGSTGSTTSPRDSTAGHL